MIVGLADALIYALTSLPCEEYALTKPPWFESLQQASECMETFVYADFVYPLLFNYASVTIGSFWVSRVQLVLLELKRQPAAWLEVLCVSW